MDYSPKAWHFFVPVIIVGLATVVCYWSIPACVFLYVVAGATIPFISYYGKKSADANYLEKLSWAMDKARYLAKEQQTAFGLAFPEITMLFGKASTDAVLMVENSEVDYRFFVEFMEQSNAAYTWAKRDVGGSESETREARREKWDKITAWAMSRRYLAAAPAGRDTYQWRSGAYLQLWNSYVLPYADLVGRKPVLLGQERTSLYQAEA